MLVGCGTTGGTGGGVVGTDLVAASTVYFDSFTLSPSTVTRNATQTVQYSVLALVSGGGGNIDATGFATFTSSDPSIVSIDGSGLATANLPGTATITATLGGVTQTSTFTVNPFVNRLFVSNFSGNSTTIYDPAVGGDQAPLRSIAGNLTTLNGPSQMAVSGQELFIANSSGNSTAVFSLHGSGNVAPKRIIAGSNTAFNAPQGIAVSNGEVFVSNSAGNSITVFSSTAAGNVTPIRTIVGAVNTTLNSPRELSVLNGELYVGNTGNGHVLVFPASGNGDIVPTRDITVGASANGLFVDASRVFVSDDVANLIQAFLPTDNGVVVPQQTIFGASLLTNLGLFSDGTELFVANSGANSTLVYPSNQSSGVPPTRSIVGTSTQLNQPGSVLIAPSI